METEIKTPTDLERSQEIARARGLVERVVSMRPLGRADKYSLNLFKFLKKHEPNYWEICFSRWNCITGVHDVEYSESSTIAPNLYIGFLDEDDGYFMGARLTEIIRNGARTKMWAHPPSKAFTHVPDFWARYVELGKCAIDPEHKLYFDKERYTQNGTLRSCDWCGRIERSRTVEKTVTNTIWELAPAY